MPTTASATASEPNSTLNHDSRPEVRVAVATTSSKVRTAAIATCGRHLGQGGANRSASGATDRRRRARRSSSTRPESARTARRPPDRAACRAVAIARWRRRRRPRARTPSRSPVARRRTGWPTTAASGRSGHSRAATVSFDDDHRRAAGAVAIVDGTARQEPHAHRREVTGHHDSHLGHRHAVALAELIGRGAPAVVAGRGHRQHVDGRGVRHAGKRRGADRGTRSGSGRPRRRRRRRTAAGRR